ncbi:MAG: type I methionyl aminopeptidase [Planctomycetota bacterium]
MFASLSVPRFCSLYSPAQVDGITEAARVASGVLLDVARAAVAGVTTHELDKLARERIAIAGAETLFEGVREGSGPAFSAATCISVNDAVVHGLPDGTRLSTGDIVTLDVGLRYRGWCADLALPVAVGVPGDRLVEAADAATQAVVERAGPDVAWSVCAAAASAAAESRGVVLVEGFGGHGLGVSLHEKPAAGFDQDQRRAGPRDWFLRPGMVLTVEPIVAERSAEVSVDRDGWTVRLAGGVRAAYRERMVAVTSSGVRVLDGLGD